jgi:two-component system sensor histidine kinase YesM
MLAVALLLSTVPLSALASRVISRPLMTLHRSMEKFKDGDFNQQVAVGGNDEISELADTFNNMVLEMRKLTDKNHVMLLMEKESELNALQAQINPHFLYNALDSLYWQAFDSKQHRLAEDILSLSELFRVLLSNGKSEITVEKELGIVRHYLHIQKMRFDKKLDYSIDVDAATLRYSIPKLILQPFVENAITHGLENKASWGCVSVTGRLADGFLCFTVRDNGAGMSKEKVAQILDDSEDSEYANQRVGSYAIRNVKERMSLRYGGEATLNIDSKPGEGTSVYIGIPADSRKAGIR